MPALLRTRAATCRPRLRLGFVLGAAMVALGLLGACAGEVEQRNAVLVLTADGVVGPVMERYIDRNIDEAERTDARAVLIKLDTPGGAIVSMGNIVQRIELSRVPVIVYVSPVGAKAASAGTFITMAGNVAAMAPNTTIGAAHPVDQGGQDIPGVMGEKVTNDAAAYARGVAKLRDRNEEWAEQSVRDSRSADNEEAVALDVVDFVALDVDDVLRQSQGRTTLVDGGRQEVTIDVAGAPLVDRGPSPLDHLLDFITDPAVFFLLLSLGGVAILIEMLNPGIIVPAVVGTIALTLAFLASGSLPVNWAGVILIFLAFMFFGAEIFVPGFGAFGVGGAIALLLGGLILTTDPAFAVPKWLIFSVAGIAGAFFLFVASALVKARRAPVVTGTTAMLGKEAVARSVIDPDGIVFYDGARWLARTAEAPINAGERVTIVAVDGLRLTVKRIDGETPEGGE